MLAALPVPVAALLALMLPGVAGAVAAPQPLGPLSRVALCALGLAPDVAWLSLGVHPARGGAAGARRRAARRAGPPALALARASAETCAVWFLLGPVAARPAWPEPVATLLAVRAQGLGSPALDRCLLPALPALSAVLLGLAWLAASRVLAGAPRAGGRGRDSLATMAGDGAGSAACGGATPAAREVGE